MSDEDDNGPINKNEEWHASLIAAQLIFQRGPCFRRLLKRRSSQTKTPNDVCLVLLSYTPSRRSRQSRRDHLLFCRPIRTAWQ
jgi:hypothetical protein